ncbi:MAG: alpha-glucan family phosphorylase [Actinomycetota bacterium]|nr:alpha-glucan family phosphorylase [Actinomycetota bacterium]
MKPIHTFTVVPALPPALEPLRELATNLRWAWDPDTVDLFRRLDPELWVETERNPVRLLGSIEQAKLESAAADQDFLTHLDRAMLALRAYLDAEQTWYQQEHGPSGDLPHDLLVAYFSAEFGITDCLSIFAGGLGVLAGDHLKSASDLGVPLVGLGLLYQQGYFRQRLNDAGWQQEIAANNDFHSLPLTLERDRDGGPVTIELGFPEGALVAQVWRAQVGRVPLYLLDANVSANTPEQRQVTHHLYGGDVEMRIRQEILLGIGGYRALEALGYEPSVYHLNEGHSAFLALERIRRLMDQHQLSFMEAREAAAPGLIFTTHTPVEAGHDYFPPDLLERYFAVYAGSLGLSWKEFVELGRQDAANSHDLFCMTVLALRLAARANGVSRLHGEVSRAMWQGLWPGLPPHEVPIGHVTNGVHLPSWTSREMSALYDRVLEGRWRAAPGGEELWRLLEDVTEDELWRTHELRRAKLVEFVRHRLTSQLEWRGASAAELTTAGTTLDPAALTIGFARRFATYKRATLLARDRDRLARLFEDHERPIQLIVSGKAHPRDDAGKDYIRQLFELSREEPFRGKIVFIEDYGIHVARYLVAGADVWLNSPQRPREACGTSGMKAAANGVLNLSTVDGWWDEAWNDLRHVGAPFGWAIGRGETYDDPSRQEAIEADALYTLLERDVIPTFYDRGEDGLPHAWIARMKSAIEQLSPCFNAHRMLKEYTETLYLPASWSVRSLTGDGLEHVHALAAWRSRVSTAWGQVRCELAAGDEHNEVQVGQEMRPRALVRLGGLTPEDVRIELYIGRVDADGEIAAGHALPMRLVEANDDRCVYEAVAVQLSDSGRYGYTVRVRPRHAHLPQPFVPGCVTWAGA